MKRVTNAITKVASGTMKFLWVTGVILAIAAGVFIAVAVVQGMAASQ